MKPEEQRALLGILVQAALCDGQKVDSERQFIRELAQQLDATAASTHLAQAVQDALLQRVTLAQAAQVLSNPAHRQLAYEWAVAVCDADGLTSTAEKDFLLQLKAQLGLSADAAVADTETQTHAVAAAAHATVQNAPVVDSAALDQMILNYAILNGALELLPQSWASVAIIPLQIKMVYRVGKAHGVTLDQGHIREFIATAGVGLTSQYVEQFGRKLLGGLVGKAGGRLLGGLAGQATGMAFSFATTYALGHLAKRYYAGGRVMSTELLRQTYQGLLGPAKTLQQQHLGDIQARARSLDATEVMRLVRS
ncbi:YcjF family protein [Tepidicella baoligensis]|uniref:YcjF family protein n=1 Tax=Tepidicella baoligensis TaxID=2707016 RepID=UPI0015DBC8A3|nr:DUF533 domain-containing protein [Tepidicella baoligensis]